MRDGSVQTSASALVRPRCCHSLARHLPPCRDVCSNANSPSLAYDGYLGGGVFASSSQYTKIVRAPALAALQLVLDRPFSDIVAVRVS